MRISKDPEERKQEILDTAMKLFCEKGYDKTSIADIAKEINVAQGLCYRYFPSKEALFDAAIDQYSDLLVGKMTRKICEKKVSLKEVINSMNNRVEVPNTLYYKVFHGKGNSTLHERLSLQVCRKLVPVVKNIINSAVENGEIKIDTKEIEAVASFCVYGQLGILNNTNLTEEEKNTLIKNILLKYFNI
ncbi:MULTISPECIES: TetR/AcrR family transcriptional regulator [unclassified Clostridium]|uniref:TetR/AcrR family transcriptional regulator n=2 Tax=Clostridium TaxID=1485 RepID=UPI0013F7B4C8|nr:MULTISPECIES: TetR/AcrR family transcriptional regulator [unclassified Clostridium]MBN1046996.1 TetR/AcrR family transcriptional regulator [Clostridium botulinum]NFN95587.1 helix-turn-helix transcriptional regulator [Clostridium botulinum]NFR85919.1 helix-turn-helix transcriptional regulator [Clostridium botulinum]NFR91317.1 helix-turn-helix transcriptional regulator [Clostridium botulinum]NFS97520.1 helix-turn-helix transcriptional regulator [Clostridium botulinum]